MGDYFGIMPQQQQQQQPQELADNGQEPGIIRLQPQKPRRGRQKVGRPGHNKESLLS